MIQPWESPSYLELERLDKEADEINWACRIGTISYGEAHYLIEQIGRRQRELRQML